MSFKDIVLISSFIVVMFSDPKNSKNFDYIEFMVCLVLFIYLAIEKFIEYGWH